MWIWILATVAAFYIKGLCGFANTLIFDTILGFSVNNVNISPVELVLGYPSNMIMTWKNRQELKRSIYIPLTIMVIAGSIPGIFLLKYVNARYIKLFFGVVVVLIGIEMMLREYGKMKMKESKVLMTIIGILSGVLCGLFGVGVVLAVYVNRIAKNSTSFKANLSAVFIFENTFRIILYSVLGVITVSSLKMSLMMLPFMLIGLFAGIKSSTFLDEKVVKKILIVLLILSGVALVLNNI